MEFTEVVSPSVAFPVLCVLVCAFLVFAFGFKSPAQPPSFDVFDDDSKKKKTKKVKGSKSQSNGHAVVSGEGDTNNSAKLQASPRQSKSATKSTQPVVTKSKAAPQPVPAELPKKAKKQAAKEEGKSSKVPEPVEDVNVDEWHTVPKKDKKQKKKESETKKEKEEPLVSEEEVVETVKEAVSATVKEVAEVLEPQEARSKKKGKKSKQDDEMEESVVPEQEPVVESKPVPVAATEPQVENIELQIQEAMETTVEDDTVEKKTLTKKEKKKALPTPEEDDFVIPQAALEPLPTSAEMGAGDDSPLKENTDALTVKIPKKQKKKDRNKRNEERIGEKADASNVPESSLSQSPVLQPKKSKVKVSSVKGELPTPTETSQESETGATGGDVVDASESAAAFDELAGATDSWTEAKPKSKKKKARRAD